PVWIVVPVCRLRREIQIIGLARNLWTSLTLSEIIEERFSYLWQRLEYVRNSFHFLMKTHHKRLVHNLELRY
ncbi:hypothetical protein LSH36_487g05042, partial [Paralvinella palmiformis]